VRFSALRNATQRNAAPQPATIWFNVNETHTALIGLVRVGVAEKKRRFYLPRALQEKKPHHKRRSVPASVVV